MAAMVCTLQLSSGIVVGWLEGFSSRQNGAFIYLLIAFSLLVVNQMQGILEDIVSDHTVADRGRT